MASVRWHVSFLLQVQGTAFKYIKISAEKRKDSCANRMLSQTGVEWSTLVDFSPPQGFVRVYHHTLTYPNTAKCGQTFPFWTWQASLQGKNLHLWKYENKAKRNLCGTLIPFVPVTESCGCSMLPVDTLNILTFQTNITEAAHPEISILFHKSAEGGMLRRWIIFWALQDQTKHGFSADTSVSCSVDCGDEVCM